MSTLELFKAIQTSDFSRLIGSQNHLFCATAQLFHIAGLILLLASIVLVSIRLLGIGLPNQSLPQLAKATKWLVWTGLGLLTVSGIVIFVPAATNYEPNFFFWSKFILLAAALVVHVTLYRKITTSETPNPLIAKTTAVLSLTLWFSVAFAGRFIGFF
ncbi:MAG: hypothetical protein Q8Q54_05160 [Methylococcales bacterium]|nr:hypothetical protein [Methylococcales bacterium]MDP3838294.1 hypothetical protein [Methylococcales bacterium]